MSKVITITVPGEPVPKPRMSRSDRWKKRDCVLRYRAYCDHLRMCVKQQTGRLPDADRVLEFSVVVFIVPPQSWSQQRRANAIGERHRVRPDASNYLKGVEDALFEEDSALADVVSRKRYDWTPRTEITIEYEPSLGEAARLPAAVAA